MASRTAGLTTLDELLELVEKLGSVSPRRVRLFPRPGTASEADLLRLVDRKEALCELVDGTLVEKAVGAPEATLAGWILRLLGHFIDPRGLGELIPGDGPLRLMAGLVRIPDVAFIRRERLPNGRMPVDPIPDLAPDLAVEVLSPSNTPGEMLRKRKEYFLAGTTLVWVVDPRRRVVEVYTAPETSRTYSEAETLDGGAVLPGLSLSVRMIFERLPPPSREETEAPPRRSRKQKPRA